MNQHLAVRRHGEEAKGSYGAVIHGGMMSPCREMSLGRESRCGVVNQPVAVSCGEKPKGSYGAVSFYGEAKDYGVVKNSYGVVSSYGEAKGSYGEANLYGEAKCCGDTNQADEVKQRAVANQPVCHVEGNPRDAAKHGGMENRLGAGSHLGVVGCDTGSHFSRCCRSCPDHSCSKRGQ